MSDYFSLIRCFKFNLSNDYIKYLKKNIIVHSDLIQFLQELNCPHIDDRCDA